MLKTIIISNLYIIKLDKRCTFLYQDVLIMLVKVPRLEILIIYDLGDWTNNQAF